MAIEFKDVVKVERNAAGKILRERLSCGHWVETAKRGLQVMNLKTKVPITKRTCKDCPPGAHKVVPATKKVAPAPKKLVSRPVGRVQVIKKAAIKQASTKTAAPAAPPAKHYREAKEAERIACPGCEGVVVCSAGCSVNKYGTFRQQDIKDAARRLAAQKRMEAAAQVAGPLAVPSQPNLLTL